MKILHFAPNEKKFVTVAAEIFDTCGELENLFRVISADVSNAQEYFSGHPNIHVVNRRYATSDALLEDLAWCDCVVVHFMDGIKAKAIMRAPRHLPVVWSGWGGDYFYLLPQGGRNLLGIETRQLVKMLDWKIGCSVSNLKQKIKSIVKKIRNRVLYASWIKKAIVRTDYFSSPFPEDFDLLRTHFGEDFHPVYTRVFYGSVERTYVPGAESIYGDNILVGNSSTATNNHLEVFKMLSRLDLGDRKIIVPLSYGDAAYRDAILFHGRIIFGDRFQPVVDFIPLDQYNTLIAQCSTVVMGHRRQQGGGNTVTMLYKGAKVFLDEANTVYQYLKNRGAFVYTLHDLEAGGTNVFEPLTDVQKYKNRMVLEEYASNEVVSRGLYDFARQIREHGGRKSEQD
ncbi:MAG: TDP-N-acetylfucosamine:lipid II N-acetylfucosaminyltransferase [Sideroxyarcus sp.]|nr:TDP-N-acetylfucosamine:lipid II N-acetylfucosaminyltransferase [Sideroxyarcus sp.]